MVMENRTNDQRSVIMLAASMFIFGTIGLFRRYIPCSSAFLAMIRGILGGLLLLVFTRIRKESTGEKLPRQTVIWLGISGAVIGINWMLLFEAYNHTTVAVATLCYYMQPTIVMLASPLLLREKLTKRKAICAMIAVIGMVLVSGVTEGGGERTGHLRSNIFNAGTIALVVIVGIVHTGFAYVLYFGSMDGLKAQSIAMLSYIDPVTALLLSALVLREPLTAAGAAGAIMILLSAVISEKRINES